MALHFLSIPDDTADLARWLEMQLTSSALGELVAELSAVHPDDVDAPVSLQQMYGSKLNEVLAQGLSVLDDAEIRNLVGHPGLLLDLQERILIDGGEYWTRPNPTAEESEKIARVWTKVSQQVGSAVQPKLVKKTKPAAVVLATRTRRSRHWLSSLALALVAFACGLLLRGPLKDATVQTVVAQTSCNWIQPGAFDQSLSREAYLFSLKSGAEAWKQVPRSTPRELAVSINQFRQGCSLLLLAEHQPLPAEDRTWLLERCRVWASALDKQLAELEAGGDFDSIRKSADETVFTLIAAIGKRAEVKA